MPTKAPRISVGLSVQEAAELREIADRNRVSCSWLARQAIIEFLERQDAPQGTLAFVVKKGS